MRVSKLFLDDIDFSGRELPPLLPLVHTVKTMKGLEYISNDLLEKPPVCGRCEKLSRTNHVCKNCKKLSCGNHVRKRFYCKKKSCERCEVFPCDNPVYLFYGKPTYKEMGSETTLNPADYKMVFIIKNYSKSPSEIIRVFPFDSGAFFHGFYDEHINSSEYSLNDFMMSTDINELRKHIWFFWGNNEEFSKYRKAKLVNDSGLSTAIIDYAKLIGSTEKEKYDSRCSVPEVQSKEIYYLLDCLQAIVVSDAIHDYYFGERGVYNFLNETIDIVKYCDYGRESPQDIKNVYKAVEDYYRYDLEVMP